MTVYVDDMRAPYRGMIMCHMMADTIAELHAMAERIGVGRNWFQDSMSGPHYDVALDKRAAAVTAGAREVTLRQMAAMAWNLRRSGSMGDPETAIAVMRAIRQSDRIFGAANDAVVLDSKA